MQCFVWWLVACHLDDRYKYTYGSCLVSDIYSRKSSTHLKKTIVRAGASVDTAISLKQLSMQFSIVALVN